MNQELANEYVSGTSLYISNQLGGFTLKNQCNFDKNHNQRDFLTRTIAAVY